MGSKALGKDFDLQLGMSKGLTPLLICKENTGNKTRILCYIWV